MITGSTDGIGFEVAKRLVAQGSRVLLHGRNPDKLQKTFLELSKLGEVESYLADLSSLKEVKKLAKDIIEKHSSLDVLINNAGVLQAPDATTIDGYDIRFMVNTIAPYILTKEFLSLLGGHGRVVNLSSAAQSPVDLDALKGMVRKMDAMSAYSQSKLAITMWSHAMAVSSDGPMIVSVNPGSLLGTKMVKEGFGIMGNDLSIGADILVRAALSDDFSNVSGKYFDNDSGCFANPHSDALDIQKCQDIVKAIEMIILDQKEEIV